MAASRLDRFKERLSSVDAEAVRSKLDALDTDFVEAGAKRITEADVETVVQRMGTLRERFTAGGPLARFVSDGRLLLDLVRDAWGGTYRSVPYWTLSAAVFALLYVLNPMDVIPDALPAVGLLDDATVLSLCLMLIEQDLSQYRTWKADRSAADAPDDADAPSATLSP